MKTLIIFIAILIVTTSCSYYNKHSSITNIKIEIPATLQHNDEIVNYINGLTAVTNEYAVLMDELQTNYAGFAKKKKEEISITDQIKWTQASAEVSIKSSELKGKWRSYKIQRNKINQQLTIDEQLALEQILKTLEYQLQKIDKKHQSAFNQNRNS